MAEVILKVKDGCPKCGDKLLRYKPTMHISCTNRECKFTAESIMEIDNGDYEYWGIWHD